MTERDSLTDNAAAEQRLVDAIADTREDEALARAGRMLGEEAAEPLRILELCRRAMGVVGRRIAQGEYVLPELMLAGEMLDRIGALAKPLLKAGPGGGGKGHGRVLVRTVHGDLHDIGKNIVTFLLDINGFEVSDIGVDVPVAQFIEPIEAFRPDVVGLRCAQSGSSTAAEPAARPAES